MKVRWTTPAVRDLESLGDYIALSDPSAAKRVVNAIFDQADTLAAHPLKGRKGRVTGTRELVIVGKPFVVAYRLSNEAVEILAVLHGARLWPESFR